jgi:hypothetical protein
MTAVSTRLVLRVQAGARRSEIVGRHGPAWKVRVAAAPERGRANEAVLGLLADRLEVPRGSMMLLSGHGSRDKVVRLTGLDGEEVERRLSAEAPR